MSKILKNTIFSYLSIMYIVLSLYSCNKEKKSIQPKDNFKDSTKSFDYKLQKYPKIFLKYWSGMTKDEYDKVTELLLKEEILKLEKGNGLRYDMGKNSLKISYFKFSDVYDNSFYLDCNGDRVDGYLKYPNDKIDGIILYGFNEETYNIFKEKYKLPNYILDDEYKFVLEENVIVNDSTTKTIKSGGKIIKRINELEYNDLIKKDKWLSLKIFTDFSKRVTIDNDIIIEKGNNVMLFKDCIDKCIREPSYIFYGDSKDEINDFKAGATMHIGDKKSKEKIVVTSKRSYLSLVFLTKSNYEKVIEKKNENMKKLIKLENEKKLKIEKRNEDFLKEI